jgi:putative addiction module killer protein
MAHAVEVRQTQRFARWFGRLRDRVARARIQARIDRARLGHFGDMKAVGAGVVEMRIDVGPGYRVYCIRRGPDLIVLLCGGDKSSQASDIREAQRLASLL